MQNTEVSRGCKLKWGITTQLLERLKSKTLTSPNASKDVDKWEHLKAVTRFCIYSNGSSMSTKKTSNCLPNRVYHFYSAITELRAPVTAHPDVRFLILICNPWWPMMFCVFYYAYHYMSLYTCQTHRMYNKKIKP